MIVVDPGCYDAQINHDHGTARAPDRGFMILVAFAPRGIAFHIRNL